jgi:hypothetical protein
VRIITGSGTLVVEVDDPNVSVIIEGEEIVIAGAGAREIRVKPGNYMVIATKDGKPITREIVTVERNGRRSVRISAEASIDNQKSTPAQVEVTYVFQLREPMPLIKLSGIPIDRDRVVVRLKDLVIDNPELKVHLKVEGDVDPVSINLIQSVNFFRQDIRKVGINHLSISPQILEEPLRLAQLRSERIHNLKQIGFALHNYYETHGQFPPSRDVNEPRVGFDKEGRPLLSWRVHLLPYIDQAPLFDEFHLNEPWDSKHNKALLSKMPDRFKSTDDPTETTFLAVVGKGTAYEGSAGLEMNDFDDGLFNMAYVVDAGKGRGVPWTKPEDLPFDPEDPIRAFGEPQYDEEFLALMADGSVMGVSYRDNPEDLKHLFLRNDGRVVRFGPPRKTPLPKPNIGK